MTQPERRQTVGGAGGAETMRCKAGGDRCWLPPHYLQRALFRLAWSALPLGQVNQRRLPHLGFAPTLDLAHPFQGLVHSRFVRQ